MKQLNWKKRIGCAALILGMLAMMVCNLNQMQVFASNVKNEATTKKTTKSKKKKKNGIVVVIDPGHQQKGNPEKEPNGPGSKTMKAKVSSGATGKWTKLPEYKLNLQVSLKLKKELEKRGYTVYMTRKTHDVDMSNKERAEFATKKKADIFVRIHANGSDNASVSGALCVAPSKKNPYVKKIATKCQSLSQAVVDAYCKETKLKNRGLMISDTMSGINWCTMPVTIVEMGYMSNKSDDTKMANKKFQKKMVTGIANGIDNYFKK